MGNYQSFYVLVLVLALACMVFTIYRMSQWLPIARITLDRPLERDLLLAKYKYQSITKGAFLGLFYAYALSCGALLLHSLNIVGLHVYLSIGLSGLFIAYLVFIQVSMYPLSLDKRSRHEHSNSPK